MAFRDTCNYYLANSWFGYGGAIGLYGMLRYFRPNRVIRQHLDHRDPQIISRSATHSQHSAARLATALEGLHCALGHDEEDVNGAVGGEPRHIPRRRSIALQRSPWPEISPRP